MLQRWCKSLRSGYFLAVWRSLKPFSYNSSFYVCRSVFTTCPLTQRLLGLSVALPGTNLSPTFNNKCDSEVENTVNECERHFPHLLQNRLSAGVYKQYHYDNKAGRTNPQEYMLLLTICDAELVRNFSDSSIPPFSRNRNTQFIATLVTCSLISR